MKKPILAALMITALATSTISHAIAIKPIFDAAALLVTTYSLLRNSKKPRHNATTKQFYDESPKAKYSFFATHVAVYCYAIPSLWKQYKEHKNNAGTIKVKP